MKSEFFPLVANNAELVQQKLAIPSSKMSGFLQNVLLYLMQVRIYMIVKLNSTRVLEKVFHNIPTKYSNKNCRENFKMRQLVDVIHYEIILS